jgi:hypothetical protein
MSKRNNVNPDYYTLAGRERPGHAAPKPLKALAGGEAARARWAERRNRKEKMKPGR